MSGIIIRIVLIITGYLFGLFQTGWFLGKAMNTNLKEQGSGNTGATNALRVIGIKGGLIVLLGDALKGFIPCMAVRLLFRNYQIEEQNAFILYTALGCVLGNNFPFFLKFDGGKGVAVSLGWMLAWNPMAAGVCIVVFAVIAFSTRYVSVASLACCLIATSCTHLFASRNFGHVQNMSGPGIEFIIIGFLVPLLVLLRHRGNIERLIHGTENRFGKK